MSMSIDVQALKRDISQRISGAVLDGGDNGYSNARSIDNGRVTHDPLLIVQGSV